MDTERRYTKLMQTWVEDEMHERIRNVVTTGEKYSSVSHFVRVSINNQLRKEVSNGNKG